MDQSECQIEGSQISFQASQKSLKVLNKQMDKLLRNEDQKIDEKLISNIIFHAKTNHSLREYIHMRYTNKLTYILENYNVSSPIAQQIKQEVERVKRLLMDYVCDFSDFTNLEQRMIKNLKTFQGEVS